MSLVPIKGLWETHITVSDLDRSVVFYRDVVGLTLAHTVPERHVAFFWIGPARHAMLGLWGLQTVPFAMRLHYAFQVGIDAAIASVGALQRAGLQPLSGKGQPIDEPEVIPWIPSASVYFRDPDGHSLEFIAMLPDPPAPTLPHMPLSAWRDHCAASPQ